MVNKPETAPKYSRDEISDASKRKEVAKEIKSNNLGIDKKKTPEGKKELSQTWLMKAQLSPEQTKSVYDELLIKDINTCEPEEFVRRVQEWQKNNGFSEKDADGILGWKTLEKIDRKLEDDHKLEDEDTGKEKSDNFGLNRVQEQAEKTEKKEETKRQIEAGTQKIIATGKKIYDEASTYFKNAATEKYGTSIVKLGLIMDASRIQLGERLDVSDGQYFALGGKTYRVTGLEKYATGTLRILTDTGAFDSNYLSSQELPVFSSKEEALAYIKQEAKPESATS